MSDGEVSIRPSTEAIYNELVGLRARRGDASTQFQKSPNLLALPATRAEVERSRFAPEDDYLAAKRVVKCGIEHGIQDPRLARILKETMNLDDLERGNLSLRRDRARNLLSEYSALLFDKLEEMAYQTLAEFLVAADSSPCAQLDQDDQPRTVSLTFSGDVTAMTELLSMLSIEGRGGVRVVLAEYVLRELPLAVKALTERGLPASGFDALVVLTEALLVSSWRYYVDAMKVLRASSMQELILSDEDADARWGRVLRQERDPSFDRGLVLQGNDTWWPTSEASLVARRSFATLADEFIRIEVEDRWPEVLGDDVHDRRPSVLI